MIRAENIKKYYGKRLALDNVSFNIEKGEIVGLLGLNGAGKTTLMRVITGYFVPSQGDVWIGDYNMLTHSIEARRQIGYLPELIPLYSDMTVRSYLDFLARLRGFPKEKIKKRIDKVIGICRLEEYANSLIAKLSKGFKQRVGIAQAIVHEPEVLILDEPTVGIDPVQVNMTRQLIKDLGKEHTVVLSTHILSEVSALCRRVLIINEGKIVAEDRIENLSALLSGSTRLKLGIEGKPDDILKCLRRVKGVEKVTRNDTFYKIEYPAALDLRGKITETVINSGFSLLSLDSAEMSLEDIFMKLTIEDAKESKK